MEGQGSLFEMVPWRHDYDDHRGCPESLCPVAATLHPAAIAIGMAALATAPAGHNVAVVCTACAVGDDAVAVVATRRGGWAATGARNDHVRWHGWYRDGHPDGPDYIGWKSKCFTVEAGEVR